MDMETRIAVLESENKRFRHFSVFALAGICAMALMGFGKNQVPDKIQAKSFEVVNDEGKVLARMNAYDGDGAVTTYKPNGEMLADIVATKSGAGGMVFYDGAGKQNLKITDMTGGGGSIVLNNAKGQSTVSLGKNNRDGGSLTINNQNGKKILLLTCDTMDAGAALTYDNDEKQTARLPGG